MATRYVESRDGTRIAVYEEGNPGGPVVVLVHGWPDSHVLWDGVVAGLAQRYRLIRYDNRGAGASEVPKSVAAYAIARLADDFDAVANAVSARTHGARGRPRLGLGHHVGVPEPPHGRLEGRVLHLDLGPDPAHLSRFIRDGLARPWRPRRFARALSQAAHFSYMIGFSVPVLTPVAMRAFLARTLNRAVFTAGIPRERRFQGDTFVADTNQRAEQFFYLILRFSTK